MRRAGEGSGKAALRAVLATALPASLRGGRKRGFAPPVARWLRGWPRGREVLASPHAPFDRVEALRLWARMEAGEAGLAPLLFNLVALVLWMEDRRG